MHCSWLSIFSFLFDFLPLVIHTTFYVFKKKWFANLALVSPPPNNNRPTQIIAPLIFYTKIQIIASLRAFFNNPWEGSSEAGKFPHNHKLRSMRVSENWKYMEADSYTTLYIVMPACHVCWAVQCTERHHMGNIFCVQTSWPDPNVRVLWTPCLVNKK